MTISLEGTHISGGTFNNVLNTHEAHVAARPTNFESIDITQHPFSVARTRRGRDAYGTSVISTRPHSPTPGSERTPAKRIDILRRFVVKEAMHDSRERFPEPSCHPGTRTVILDDLRAWSMDTPHQGQLGASFFFRRGHPNRGTWNGLLTTIAYQLATSVAELLQPIQLAVERDQLLGGSSMAVQFQQLLVEPFKHTPRSMSSPIIVLDGLDECEDHKVQQAILRLFIKAVGHCRPEPHLREALQSADIFGVCRHCVLTADEAAYNDVRVYLRDEFARIYSESRARGLELESMWPSEETLEHLVKKSSGTFIYAVTVIRFVEDEYSHPVVRLESVLNLDPESTAPLDDLYTQILSVPPQSPHQLALLYTIWRSSISARLKTNPEDMDLILNLHPGSCRLALRGLHSLFEVPPPRPRRYRGNGNPVYFLHASFRDYLRDDRRSGPLCVMRPSLDSDYLHGLIRLLSSPPLTWSTVEFYREILVSLSEVLVDVVPSDTLITLLRNQDFQESCFLVGRHHMKWPQRNSVYPSDLIKLWEHHSSIPTLLGSILPDGYTKKNRTPTLEFDSTYFDIFTRYPEVLAVLRAATISPFGPALETILYVYGLTYRVFEPFLQYRQLLYLRWHDGDSPWHFLQDPLRAGTLYRERCDIAEEFMLLWIMHAKEVIRGTSDFGLHGHDLVIRQCRTTQKLLHEVESLSFIELYDATADEEYGDYLCEVLFQYGFLENIVAWLKAFHNPPLHVIKSWEAQIAYIVPCNAGSASSEYTEAHPLGQEPEEPGVSDYLAYVVPCNAASASLKYKGEPPLREEPDERITDTQTDVSPRHRRSFIRRCLRFFRRM
ncbi:hypothetical protein B0H14DRAFT_2917051 [Mycena olivaceomarginata]|nr:hypothetical protein B0H14DRAFT_2917051 [Mycena olivaceomarginata]